MTPLTLLATLAHCAHSRRHCNGRTTISPEVVQQSDAALTLLTSLYEGVQSAPTAVKDARLERLTSVAVTIGRDIAGTPMSADRWDSFRIELASLIAKLGGFLWASNSGVGLWDGCTEDNHVVIADLPQSKVPNLRAGVIPLGIKYQQQAVAILTGTSELIHCSANQPISAASLSWHLRQPREKPIAAHPAMVEA